MRRTVSKSCNRFEHCKRKAEGGWDVEAAGNNASIRILYSKVFFVLIKIIYSNVPLGLNVFNPTPVVCVPRNREKEPPLEGLED